MSNRWSGIYPLNTSLISPANKGFNACGCVHLSLHIHDTLRNMRSFSGRVKGAMLVKVDLYEEVEADDSATGQAVGVVVLASLAAGIGIGSPGGVRGLVAAIVVSIIGWFIWAGLSHLIGTHILPTPDTESSWAQMLRTTGFAAAPGMFRIFSLIPVLGLFVDFAVLIWMLVTFVVAVRQALDYTSTWRAILVCLSGWLAYVFLGVMLVPLAG